MRRLTGSALISNTEPILKHTRAIDDAREPVCQHGKLGAHTSQQKDRGDSQLNDMADVSELNIHG